MTCNLQIDVAVNAPDAGTIKEFLVKEEDTVTVNQDIVKIELGGAPSGGAKEEGKSDPKAAASGKQPTSSDPEPKKEKDAQPSPPPPPPPKDNTPEKPSKPSSAPPEPHAQKEAKPKSPEPQTSSTKSADTSPFGNREERRVSRISFTLKLQLM